MSVKNDYTQITVNDENLENEVHLECLGCKLDLPSLSGGDLPLDLMEVILQIQSNGGDLNNLSDAESIFGKNSGARKKRLHISTRLLRLGGSSPKQTQKPDFMLFFGGRGSTERV